MSRIRDLTAIALLAALLAVCSWLTVPFGPVPFTMQTFAVFAALGLLGGRRGTVAILVYLCLGLVGLPVFSGFSGGVGQLVGPTGGYLIGFVIGGLVYWAFTARRAVGPVRMAVGLILALAVCYAFGTVWFLTVYTGGGSAGTLGGALALCVFPYLLPDAIKLALAMLLVRRVGRYVPAPAPLAATAGQRSR